MQDFLPVAALPQWGLSVKVAHLLGLRGPWQCQVCRDMNCLHHRSYGTLKVFFRAFGSWRSEDLFGQSFSVAPPIQALRVLAPLPGALLCCLARQAHRGAPLAGVLLCSLAHQSLKGAPWVGSYSVVQCIRCLMGQPLCCSAANAGYGEREAIVMAPPATCDSAVSPCFHGCPSFLHRYFPPQSPSSSHLDPSLHSQQQPLPWDCSTTCQLQLSASAPSRGPASLSEVCMAAARTVWFSFHLGCHKSAVLLLALMFLLWLR